MYNLGEKFKKKNLSKCVVDIFILVQSFFKNLFFQDSIRNININLSPLKIFSSFIIKWD